MAYYRKRGKSWQARVSWYEDGKRKYKTKSGFSTKALAKKWSMEAERKLSLGINIEKKISLIEYYDHWVETYKKPKVAPITYKRYEFTRTALENFFHDTEFKKSLVVYTRSLLMSMDIIMHHILLRK